MSKIPNGRGIPTFGLGIATWFFLADDPQSARYLTDKEKEMMAHRLSRQYGETQSEDTLHSTCQLFLVNLCSGA